MTRKGALQIGLGSRWVRRGLGLKKNGGANSDHHGDRGSAQPRARDVHCGAESDRAPPERAARADSHISAWVRRDDRRLRHFALSTHQRYTKKLRTMNIRRVARSPSLQSRSYAADDEFPHPQGGVLSF